MIIASDTPEGRHGENREKRKRDGRDAGRSIMTTSRPASAMIWSVFLNLSRATEEGTNASGRRRCGGLSSSGGFFGGLFSLGRGGFGGFRLGRLAGQVFGSAASIRFPVERARHVLLVCVLARVLKAESEKSAR